MIASELFFPPATRSRPRRGRPPSMRSFSILRSVAIASARINGSPKCYADVAANKLLEQQVAIDLPDQRSGVLMAGDVGRIPRHEIPDNLVHRIIPTFDQGAVDVAERLLDVPKLAPSNLEHPGLLALSHTVPPSAGS